MLLVGLLPLLAAAWLTSEIGHAVLSVSPRAVEAVLEHVEAGFDAPASTELRREVAEARLNLAQADLVMRALLRWAPWAMILLLALSTAMLVLIAALLGRRVAAPLERLAEGMRRYASGEFDYRVPLSRAADDELTFVTRQFNDMGRELEANRQRLREREELAAWQQVARSMAHELKNPLTAMKMALARIVRAQNDEGPVKEAALLLETEVGVLTRLTESFSAFAKLPRPVPRPLDLTHLLDEVRALYLHTSPVPIERDTAAPEAIVEGDADQLRRAFGNLVKNAVEASGPGSGAIQIAVAAEGDAVCVTLCDAGSGIAAAIEGSQLVRSLGSTKASGSGLGLPTAYKIIHEHGGTLRLLPGTAGGTRAIVTLPRAPCAPCASSRPERRSGS